MCCSTTQLAASCISTSANAMEAIFRGQGYGIRCPRLGFLLAAASRAIGAAVQPPESKYRSSRAAPPVHSRSVPSTQCQHSSSNWDLVQPASTTLLRHALDKFCPWWRKFQCCLFDRCTLCHDPCGFMCVGLHRNKRVDLCCCLKVLRCASVGLQDLQSCPHAARVHRLRSTHRVRFLCGAAAKCVSHLHVHQPRETRDHARTFARARATHRSRLAPSSTYASASASVPHHLCPRCHHGPAPATWGQPSPSGRNMLSLEGLKIPTLAPLVVAMRVTLQQLLEDGTRPLTQVPWLVPDRPHGWQRRGHLQ